MAKEVSTLPASTEGSLSEPSMSRRRPGRRGKEREHDAHRLEQRTKQLTYGENTVGYRNLLRALELYPELFKGCLPVKPVVTQKCSKRSWDGQVRKWRRLLHMYDLVDFEDDEQATAMIRAALIRQNRNPLFLSPNREACAPARQPAVDLRLATSPETVPRVRYTMTDLMRCADSGHVRSHIQLPEPLQFLDKRTDLEDDVGLSDSEDPESPRATMSSSPFTPGYSPAATPGTPHGERLLGSPMPPGQLFPESPASPPSNIGRWYALQPIGSPHPKRSSDSTWDSPPAPTAVVPAETLASVLAVHAASQVAMPLFQFTCGPQLYTSLLEVETSLHRLCV